MAYRSRERVARVLAHEEADRVPFDASGSRLPHLIDPLGLGPDHRALCLAGDFEYVPFGFRQGDREVFARFLPGLPEEAELTCWGVGTIPLKTADGFHAGHTYFHPLAGVDTVQALDAFPFPDFDRDGNVGELSRRVTEAKRQGYTVVGQASQTILETAYVMRGMERLMADLYERPAYVDCLFGKLAEQRCIQARAYAEAGVDVLRIGDDIATQEALLVSPAMYRERIKPHHAAVVAAAREINADIHVLYHSDGDITELLPDLIDVGVTAINPAQPECMDLAQVKREFGGQLTLWGCMPVQSTFAHGPGDEVRRYLEFLMERIAPGGGLVLNFINMILTPRVEENLKLFFAEIGELGTYRRS